MGFLPSDDVGQMFVFTEAAQDISFEAMTALHRGLVSGLEAARVAAERGHRVTVAGSMNAGLAAAEKAAFWRPRCIRSGSSQASRICAADPAFIVSCEPTGMVSRRPDGRSAAATQTRLAPSRT